MAIDLDADIAAILGSGTDLPRTTGMTYTNYGTANSDTIAGVLVERNADYLDDDRGVQMVTALLLVDKDEFSNVSVWGTGDTVNATSDNTTWTVTRVRARQEHLTLDLAKTVMPGRS